LNLKLYFLISIGIIFRLNIYAQEIRITASNQTLNKVLLELREKYDVELSFNGEDLSKYKVSLSRTFKTAQEAVAFLLQKLPFEFENISGVLVIYPKKVEIRVEKPEPKVYRISGRIMEKETEEALPFSNIMVNSTGIISDQNGNFLFSSIRDSVFRIKISHLGYLLEDTTIFLSKSNISIYMTPSDQVLEEIKVSDNLIEDFVNIGNEAACIKLNHKVTKYLPGSSDNSVYNLLRLQPGVLAAGEQSSDLIIWGAYAGQSRIIFDGFTVFGLKNFNDNISAINPLITKNIQLRKAGYDASYGDCVGGIVEISGNDGNAQKVHFNLGVNNFTVNSLLEIPIFRKSSLQIAYRQTYYNLYKDGFNLFKNVDSLRNLNVADIYIYPDYFFRDFNVKYTYKNDDNLFYISILNGNDDFSYSFTTDREYRDIVKSAKETNHQLGAAIYWEKKLSDHFNANVTVSRSGLSKDVSDKYDIYSTITEQLVNQRELIVNNEIWETKAKLQTIYRAKKAHTFETTFQLVDNTATITEDSVGISSSEIKQNEEYYTFGFKDVINFQNNSADIGFRASYLPYLDKPYIEPRISFSQGIGENLRYNLSWGIYNQFLVKSSVIDEYGNYRYVWTIADNEHVPVLKSYHNVAGLSFNHHNFSASIDAFYKTIEGITRYIRLPVLKYEGISKGNGMSYGFDFYTKYNFSGHTLWFSYTWSKSLEHFSYMKTQDYLYAPQDQRHELKIAAIVNLSPVFLSANYVFGSGFLEHPFMQQTLDNRIPYNRLDVSATYKFLKNKNIGEFGVSILNVLNTQNQKFSNFDRIPLTQISSTSIYFEAVPFTPTIFLKLNL